MKPRKNSFLIVGANGYLGRHVTKLLDGKGLPFLAADLAPASVDGHKSYASIDVLKEGALDGHAEKFDYVLVFAGLTGTYDGFKNYKKFVELNETALLHLLDSVRKNNPGAKIIFPSSRLVYRGQKDNPLNEDAEKEFKTIYAINKFAGEQYLAMYQRSFGLDFSVFRICVPYGNLIDDKLSFGTISHMVTKAAKGEDIVLYGDGGQKRSLIHIEDVTEILIEAATNPATDNGVYNIGGPDTLSLRDIAGEIAGLYGVSVKSVEWPPEQLAIESGDTIFDSGKIMKIVKYRYRHDFRSWVKSLKKT